MKSQQPPAPDKPTTAFVHPDPAVQKEMEQLADALIAEVDAEDAAANPAVHAEDEEDDEDQFWSLVAGQCSGENGEIIANVIPGFEWEEALEAADGDAPNGSVILTAPSGDYVQALAKPEGFVLEYREIWPREKTPGFRHYRARMPDAESQPPRDVDAADTWMANLEAVVECFECFTEYPDETPELAAMEWWNVTADFPPLLREPNP